MRDMHALLFSFFCLLCSGFAINWTTGRMDWSFTVAFFFFVFWFDLSLRIAQHTYTPGIVTLASLATIISSFIATQIEIEITYEYNHLMYSHYILILINKSQSFTENETATAA